MFKILDIRKTEKVGEINNDVIKALNLDIKEYTPIYLGESNINHMTSRHPIDYYKYGKYITDIIIRPDYVGINSKDNSIEYVKEFHIDGEYVKVAVRVSNSGQYFARSIYTLNKRRVENFIRCGTLKKLTFSEE